MADTLEIDLKTEFAGATEARRKLELDAEYQSLVLGSTQEETQAHWIWYLKERYAINQHPDIFREIQHVPRSNGNKNIWRYLDGELTARQFQAIVRTDTGDLYAQSLIDCNMVLIEFDQAYDDLCNKPIYESLKQYDLLKAAGGDLRKSAGVCTASATFWWSFVELLHAHCDLPTVAELQYKLEKQSVEEKVVVKERNFSAFELTEKEIEAYKLLVSAKIA